MMKIFRILFIFTPICKTFGLDEINVVPKTEFSCGLWKAGAIIQQVTKSISEPGGMLWSQDHSEKKLTFVDRYNPATCRYTLDGSMKRMPLKAGQMMSSIHQVANSKANHFVVVSDRSLYHLGIRGNGENRQQFLIFIRDIVDDNTTVLIKGKTDKEGRLWYTGVGSSGGCLYKIEKNKPPQLMESDLETPDGIGWTMDGQIFYIVDREEGLIYAYDFDMKQGTIANRRSVFDISYQLPTFTASPTDLEVDTQGYLWIGAVYAGQVIQFDPENNTVLRTISIPAKDVVGLEFGGAGLRTLFVATSTHFAGGTNTDPDSGSIFALSGLGVEGILDSPIVI